jgi:hypothetical protein
MFLKMPNDTRLAMILYSVQYTVEFGPNTLLRSLLPALLVGEGPPSPSWSPPVPVGEVGDPGAKEEARRMMRAFTPTHTPSASVAAPAAGEGESASVPAQETSQAELVGASASFPAPFQQ